jgi:hypothetical protein
MGRSYIFPCYLAKVVQRRGYGEAKRKTMDYGLSTMDYPLLCLLHVLRIDTRFGFASALQGFVAGMLIKGRAGTLVAGS